MPTPPTVIHLSRTAWAVVAIALLLPWVMVAWLLQRAPAGPAATRSAPAPSAHAPAAGSTPPPTPAASEGAEVIRGQWGELELQRIMLEPPEEFIRPDAGSPDPLHWTFKNTNAQQLDALWQRARLTPTERQFINQRASHPAPDVTIIAPTPEFIIALSAESRATIYGALAAWPENQSQHEPFRYRADGVEEWFANTNVAPEIVALTRRLVYRSQNTAFFADEDVVLPRIPVMADRLAFLKMIARRSGLVVRLRVPHDANIDEIARYWRHSRRTKSIKPLLASLAAPPGGGIIDIIHLLPPFARQLLNTYPDPATNTVSHDCHWTSFNFLEDAVDERYTNIDYVRQRLLSDYYQVTDEPMLGDILVLVRADGVVVHSCVHIADGIVFTKNGSNIFVPWTLSRLENVVAAYAFGDVPVETRRYRLKQP